MSLNSRREYLAIKQAEYVRASRRERSAMLDEMAKVTQLNRKYITQLMNSDLRRQPRQRQRGRTYSDEEEAAVLFVAECLDFICGKRLKPVLLSTAKSLERHGEMTLSPRVEASLARISASTIDRIYARNRDRVVKRLPRKRPAASSRVLQQVPMSKIAWDEQEPGHLEVDSVFHCGGDSSGDFVYTIQAVDVATGWSERYAVLGKSWIVMEDAFQAINHRLPFPILEIHTDNGSEFLNRPMLRFWRQQVPGARLSRNRPWSKNDSRFVEQKNFTLVRAFLEGKRYDTVAQTWAINFLYECMGLYYNFFQPVFRSIEKIWIEQEGRSPRLKRKHDKPSTPLDRLIATGTLSDEEKGRFLQLRDALNVRRLKLELEDLLSELGRMPNALPGQQEDVYHTLTRHRPLIQKGAWDPWSDYHLTQPLP